MNVRKHMPEAGGREREAPDRPEPRSMVERLVAVGVLVTMVVSLSPGLFERVLEALRPPAVRTPR
jgi:hypothetical protein